MADSTACRTFQQKPFVNPFNRAPAIFAPESRPGRRAREKIRHPGGFVIVPDRGMPVP
jgi:hypothetical protein